MKQYKYVFGELKGDLRFCECGDVSTEWEMHVCPLTEVEVPDEPKSPHHLITNIEDKTANMDMGRMGYQMMQGAMEEGATMEEAIIILTAYFAGMFTGVAEQNRKDKENEDEDGHSN